MVLKIIIGKIKRGDKWKPLLLEDVLLGDETTEPQLRHKRRVIRGVASLKHKGKRRTKSWVIDIEDHVAATPEDAARGAAAALKAQAERWEQSILNPKKPQPQAFEPALIAVEPTFDPSRDLLA